ncbi:TonB-dependent receptor [Flavobacterium psychrophilum]|nr:TonB-dependent receptor [Flavobacterium psychrophilum]AOE51979.1 TonB-dependent receptor [Flavobacterium psychrophilum]
MTLRKFILPLLLLLCQLAVAQTDTITLKEVIVSDTQLRDYSASQSVLKLNDSIINKNASSLTSLLNYNSVIYFKENGLGMVSSPSFRGTTAQQTAVLWNGININSQLLGQTDFNTLTTRDFSSISVKAGGGSVIYGTSAIGGSIHLNNDISFGEKFNNTLKLNYGSFNTKGLHYKADVASDVFTASVSLTRNSSDNDYEYSNGKGENLNGQFYNNSMNVAVGYKLNDNNTLKFYSYFFDGERHFSLIFPSEVKTKYQDTNTRNMLEWDGAYGKFTSKLKAAYLKEQYKYYANIDNENHTYGRVESIIGKYDLAFNAGNGFVVNAVLDFMNNKGFGSDIEGKDRQIGAASLLLKHQVTNKLSYEAGVRKEITSNYESPVLFSAGARYKPFSFYTLKLNASKNFRIPTFNDLYWVGSGNTDLKPESSWQGEIGNEFAYKGATLSITGYYIKLKDMLRWLPSTGGVWRPVNTDRVKTYGLEALLNYKRRFGDHELGINGTYGYTVSENEDSGMQLIYVPYHKATAALSYGYKKITAYYQFLYNGEVFTRSDNDSRYNIDSYTVGNAGLEYSFGKNDVASLGVQVLNVLNKEYESVDSRPLPGRNYNVYLTLNF